MLGKAKRDLQLSHYDLFGLGQQEVDYFISLSLGQGREGIWAGCQNLHEKLVTCCSAFHLGPMLELAVFFLFIVCETEIAKTKLRSLLKHLLLSTQCFQHHSFFILSNSFPSFSPLCFLASLAPLLYSKTLKKLISSKAYSFVRNSTSHWWPFLHSKEKAGSSSFIMWN